MAKQLDIPIVHTYHTMYEDYVHYITKGHFDLASKKAVEYLTKFYCDKTVTELIVPTKKTYDLFKKKYEYDRNVHIVPTGIEVDRFYKENNNEKRTQEIKEQYGIKKDDFIVLFVGRLAEEKNVKFLIDNQKELIKHNKKCKLMIIGDGPDRKMYEEYANDNNRIKFFGKKENPYPYMNKADYIILTSDYEGFPVIYLEALVLGKQIITTIKTSDESINIEKYAYIISKDEKTMVKEVKDILNQDVKKKTINIDSIQKDRMKLFEELFNE